MTEPTSDLSFWQWASGVAVAIFGGLVGGGWTARGLLEGLRRDNEAQNVRISALEKRQTECSVQLRQTITETVQQAMDKSDLRNAEQLEAIRQDVAVMKALFGETRDDVREIFNRLNTRQVDLPVHNDRRKRDVNTSGD